MSTRGLPVRALSSYSAALACGAVAGQMLGGLLVSADLLGLGWRPVFLMNLPITLAVLLAGRRILPPDRAVDHTQRLDVFGAATLASAVLLVVTPLTLGREAGWPLWTWCCLAVSVGAGAAFVAIER